MHEGAAAARAQADLAVSEWHRAGWDAQRVFCVFAHVQADLYAGRTAEAEERLASDWDSMSRAFYTRFQRIAMGELRARTILARAWERGLRPGDERRLRTHARKLLVKP